MLRQLYFLFCCFASYIVLLYAVQSDLESKLVQLSNQILSIKTDIMNSIRKEIEEKPIDSVETKVLKNLKDVALAELAIEELRQFVVGVNSKKSDRDFLVENHSNLVHLKKMLQLSDAGEQSGAAKKDLQILKKDLISKIDQAILACKAIKSDKKSKQKISTKIVEQKLNILLRETMQNANLHTTIEFKKLVEECAQFGTETSAQKSPEEFGSIEKNWANFVKISNKKFVGNYVMQIEHFIRQFLSADGLSDQPMVKEFTKQFNKIKTGKMPSENDENQLKTNSDCLLNETIDLNWQNVAVYPTETMSNWRLAMRGYWALADLFKNGIGQNAKFLAGTKKGEEQQREKGSDHRRFRHEQWLKDNAEFIKSAYSRLFPAGNEDEPQRRQKSRRRRKRGGVRCRRSVDWNAWIQCISLILLYIIFFCLLIYLLASSKSGGNGSNSRSRSYNSRRSWTSTDNSCCTYSGQSWTGGNNCCCCCITPQDNQVADGSGGYCKAYASHCRPTLTFWNSCSVVWYDLWN